MLFEGPGGTVDGAVAIGQHGRAVVDHRVLSTDHVDVGQGHPGFGNAGAKQGIAAGELVMFEWRGIGHDDEFGAASSGFGHGFGEPEVLADHDTNAHALDLDHAGATVRIDLEIAAFVEHGVVGQFALAIGRRDAAVAQDAGRVVDDGTGRLRPADDGDDSAHVGGNPLQRGFASGEERRAQEQIFR